MTRILSILPFLLIACDPAEDPVEQNPTGESTEQTKPKPKKTTETKPEAESTPEEGASLEITTPEFPISDSPGWQTEVGVGESLVLLSKWADTSVEEIGELNQIDVRAPLYPGDSILLPLVEESEISAFQDARVQGRQDRLDRYLGSRGGLVDLDVHVVRTGETAWQIAHDQAGIPLWVLASFNEDVDLQILGIGDPLHVPVLGDTVAVLDFEDVDSIPHETLGLPIDFE